MPAARAIPQKLIDAGARFIMLSPGSKIPTEKGYHKDANYDGTEELFQRWLNIGNYGVLPRNGVSFIDIDNFSKFKETGIELPDSFIVRRGTAQRGHYYFICPDCPEEYRDKHLLTFGDIRLGGANWFVVGPSCRHPSGEIYEIFRDYPLAVIPFAWLKEKFSEIKPKQKEVKRSSIVRRYTEGKSLADKLGLSMDMFLPGDATPVEDGYQGANPWHGSSTGWNYKVDTRNQRWSCFRHNPVSGGGPVEAYAVSKGIIDCSEAGKGCLEGRYSEVYRAREEEGWTCPDVIKSREELRDFLKNMGLI